MTITRILITGATGLVGQELVALCHQNNIAVNYLTTSKHKIVTQDNYQGFYWNIETNEIDTACFKDVDIIVNLVGASIAKKWTTSYKKELINSRVDSALLLLESLKTQNHSIKHIISASAIGVYPSSLTNFYSEDSIEVNTSFLSEIVRKWETVIDAFSVVNIKISKLRIGLVLSSKGGVLEKMAQPIKYGAGAAFGDGKHWQSWIHVKDLVRLILFTASNDLEGIFNAVAPNPVSNTVLTKQIASQLNKPLILPNIPKFAMKFALGEMHQLLYESQRVSSAKIEAAGFDFKFPNLEPALEDLL
jgi:uncharacterized protein (TIGR01777 family)